MAKFHAWVNPILIAVIGFFLVYTLNGVNKRLDKLEEKMDRIARYEIILERLGSGKVAIKTEPLPPFKHEDFITLKIVNDERIESV